MRSKKHKDAGSTQQAARHRWQTMMGAAALFALILIVYIPVTDAGFVWDDHSYVTQNPTLGSTEGLREIWLKPGATPQYYPLVFTTFWIEHAIWQLKPLGYHVVNVVLHAIGAILVWFVLRKLAVPGAWVAAAVFAIHPVHVESVAWVTERKNVLSGVFYFATVLSYIHFLRLDDGSPERRGEWRFWGGALCLFVLALLCKTSTVTLPAAILLVVWWKRGAISRRDVLCVLPFFAAAVALGVVTAWVEWFNLGGSGQGALGDEWSVTPAERFLVAGRALWFYAGQLVWPGKLSFIYTRWTVDGSVWWQYLYPIAAIAVLALLWMLRHRIGRGPLTSLLFFAGTLTPVLGFFNIFFCRYSFVADHFQYLPSLGVIVLVVAGVTTVAGRAMLKARWVGPLASVVVLSVLGSLAWQREHAFKDLKTLWFDTIEKNPTCWLAHNNLGMIFRAEGSLDKAETHFAQAVRINPNLAEAQSNLGAMLARRDEAEQALLHFTKAIELMPDSAGMRANAGQLLTQMGRYDEAAVQYAEAVRMMPRNLQWRLTLGRLLVRLERIDEAIEQFREASQQAPDNPTVRRMLDAALEQRDGGGDQ